MCFSSHKMLLLLCSDGDEMQLLLLLFSLEHQGFLLTRVGPPAPGRTLFSGDLRHDHACSPQCQGGNGMKVRWGDLSYVVPFLFHVRG